MTDSRVVSPLPEMGKVPSTMLAQVVRKERFGDPVKAFQIEEVDVPSLKPGEVLIGVMAAGINYNNVWAARGFPIDVIAVRQKAGEVHDFHIGGSDASGIVYAVGAEVRNVSVGDEVVVHPGHWDPADPTTKWRDPMLSNSAVIWGYNTNFGSFGQFSVVQSHQVLPKPPALTWEEAAASTLVGTTAYRMLLGWEGNTIRPDDVVLVWGGSGGLGTQAIQLTRAFGGIPVAVVSDAERGEYCVKMGAEGYIDRSRFDHWGEPPPFDDAEAQKAWTAGARAFGKELWEILGTRRNPNIVFEHPGESTIPTSIFMCETGGMVVICAGTTGYRAVVDLRYHWVRQKRLQGSHGTNDEQAIAYNRLLHEGKIDPCLGQVYPFEGIGQAHADMEQGLEVFGNRVALVGAAGRGEGAS